MSTANDYQFCTPSAWWIWLAVGSVGLLITVGIGALFGLSPADVLLGRDISVVLFISVDYGILGYGVWLAIKVMLGRSRNAL